MALGCNDQDRAGNTLRGIVGKRLTYVGPTSANWVSLESGGCSSTCVPVRRDIEFSSGWRLVISAHGALREIAESAAAHSLVVVVYGSFLKHVILVGDAIRD